MSGDNDDLSIKNEFHQLFALSDQLKLAIKTAKEIIDGNFSETSIQRIQLENEVLKSESKRLRDLFKIVEIQNELVVKNMHLELEESIKKLDLSKKVKEKIEADLEQLQETLQELKENNEKLLCQVREEEIKSAQLKSELSKNEEQATLLKKNLAAANKEILNLKMEQPVDLLLKSSQEKINETANILNKLSKSDPKRKDLAEQLMNQLTRKSILEKVIHEEKIERESQA